MYKIKMTDQADGTVYFMVPSLLGDGRGAWGDETFAIQFPTTQDAQAFYNKNRPRRQFLAGRVVDAVKVS